MVLPDKFPPFREMEAFWINGKNTSTSSESWDWSRDARQRQMMRMILERNVDRVEMFSNSPVWWMCMNDSPAGAENGGNNLRNTDYASHAYYMAAVAAYAKKHWNVTFASVEPFNEPSGTWQMKKIFFFFSLSFLFFFLIRRWKFTNHKQEGCHIDASIQAMIIPELRNALDKLGCEEIIVAASDESQYDTALSTWNSFSSSVKEAVSRVNVHGYEYGGGRRDLLYNAVVEKDKKMLWNSEYGDGDASGAQLTKNLNLDFYWLHNTAWSYWQALDGGG